MQQQNAARAGAPAPPAATPPVVNLNAALGNMPDLDADKLTEAFKQFYTVLEDSNMTADKYVSLWAAMNDEVAAKGYIPDTGPQLMLVNIGNGNLHVMHSVMKLPPKAEFPRKDITSASNPFNKHEYVAVYGNRADSTEIWTVSPVKTNLLYNNLPKVKLAAWPNNPFPRPAPADAVGLDPNGADAKPFPYLLLPDKIMAKKAIAGCYPADPADRWTLKQAMYELNVDIDKITDLTVKAKAQESLLSLVTKNSRGTNQPASIKVNQTAITNKNAAPIVAWATPIIEKILDPPINASATTTTTGGTSSTPASQASTTTTTGGSNSAQLQQQQPSASATTLNGGTSSTPAPASITTTATGGTNIATASSNKTVTFGGVTTTNNLHAIHQSRYEDIFNIGPAAVHTSIHGQPPPTKQAKLSTY